MKKGVFSRLDMGERKGATVGVGERERERERASGLREREGFGQSVIKLFFKDQVGLFLKILDLNGINPNLKEV